MFTRGLKVQVDRETMKIMFECVPCISTPQTTIIHTKSVLFLQVKLTT